MSLVLLPRTILNKWRHALAGRRQTKSRKSNFGWRSRPIRLESLEDRTLLASSGLLGTFSVNSGVGTPGLPVALASGNYSAVTGLSVTVNFSVTSTLRLSSVLDVYNTNTSATQNIFVKFQIDNADISGGTGNGFTISKSPTAANNYITTLPFEDEVTNVSAGTHTITVLAGTDAGASVVFYDPNSLQTERVIGFSTFGTSDVKVASVNDAVPAATTVGTSFANVPGLTTTFTTSGSDTVRLQGTVSVTNVGTNTGLNNPLNIQYLIDGVATTANSLLLTTASAGGQIRTFAFENDFTALAAGLHTIAIQASTSVKNNLVYSSGTQSFGGSMPSIFQTLRIVEYLPIANSSPYWLGNTFDLNSNLTAGTAVSAAGAAVTGLSQTFSLTTASTVRMEAALAVRNSSTTTVNTLLGWFQVDGTNLTQYPFRIHFENSSSPIEVNVPFEDFTTLAAGTHTVTVFAQNSVGTSLTFEGGAGRGNQTLRIATFGAITFTSTTTVSSSLNPSIFSQSVTFTATVSDGSGSGFPTPTGTVTFLDGASTLGTASLSGGTASFTTSSLSLGTHTITVQYGGDSNSSTSSGVLSQTVNKFTTSTTVTSSVNPSALTQSVTFTATVTTPFSGTPTGTVTFLDGASTLGTASLSSATATFSTSSLSGGNHTITVAYGGDSSFATSTSTAITQTVQKAASATSITSSPNGSTFGQSVTFTATVTSGVSVTATGTVTFLDGAATVGTASLSSGTATLTTAALSAGVHTITASYAGDTNFNSSVSTAITQTVAQATSSTAVTSSLNPSIFGQTVTFTASVTPQISGTATGTVTFLDGGSTTLGTASLSGGTATFSTTMVSAGFRTITVSYAGDSNFTGSTSPAITQTVNKATTTMTRSSSLDPSTFGQSVTFTATVIPQFSGTPTGTVTFIEGVSTTLGVATLSGGVATLTTTSVVAGPTKITMNYSGDSNFNSSAATVLTQTVNKATTSTSLTTSLNPAIFGQTVTLTATVTPQFAGPATGTVTFLDGGTTLGTASPNGAGVATLSTTSIPTGVNTITATYGGDANFNGSTSTAITETISQATSSTTVTSSLNPSSFNQLVTLTATVHPQFAGTPTGTATFLDGAATLAAVPLSGGSATFASSTLSGGNHVITVTYSGDSNFGTSTSAALTQTVNQQTTTTTLTTSKTNSIFGQSINFTATVIAQLSGTPTGTVAFLDGSTTLATGSLSFGTVTMTLTNVPAGVTTVTAQYLSDGNYGTSTSAPVTETVLKATTSISETSTLNPSTYGQTVTFTGTVVPEFAGSPLPTGTVTFLDGLTPMGTVALTPNATMTAATATFTTFTLTGGIHKIIVSYPGDSNFNGNNNASPAFGQTVNPAPSTTTLSSSINPSLFGQSVNFTAVVTAVSPGFGFPTGTVTFLEGMNTLGTANLSSGTAVLSGTLLSTGTHTVIASYSGDANFNSGVSPAITQTVNQAGSTTTVTSSLNPSVFGDTVTFTATVAPQFSGTATGTVTFLDGSTTLGANVLMPDGTTTISISTLAVGVHPITASYSGDTNFTGSTSTAISQTVTLQPTTTTVTSSLNPSIFGEAVTFTAMVSAVTSGTGTPTGSVDFLDGATTLATVSLAPDGSAAFTTSGLSGGTHSITVNYSGDANFQNSMSNVLSQTVEQSDSTTTLTSSSNPSVFGQAVTFTASISAVSPGAGTATGTVTYLDGSATIGTASLFGGSAMFTTAGLSAGVHTITASYGGDTNFNASLSSAITQTVAQSDSATTVVSSINPSVFGQTVTFTATVFATGLGGGTPGGTVTFLDSAATLGTVALSGGTASIATSSLTLGNHNITASYSGDANFNSSASAAITQTVGQASTSTTVTSSTNPSTFGQAVTFTATVAAAPPSTGVPTGTVAFLDGSATLATASLSSGTASFTTTALSAGSHTITVSYAGDGNFAGSTSAAITQTVNQDTSTTTVASSINPSLFGQLVTFTATVSTPNGETAMGAVTFLDGSATLGTAGLNSGTAALATSSLSVGNHTITATYAGDSNVSGSTSAAITQTVNMGASSSTVSSSLNPSHFGQSVTFTATVSAVSPSVGTPGGTVTFLDGAATLGTAVLSGGSATLSTSTLANGTHTITAFYAGDANFSGNTSAALTQTVNGKSDSTTSVASNANPSVFGQAVTFTATVTGPGGTPGGTVTFLDSGTTLATANLSGGMGSLTTSSLTVGNHTITVAYSGDSNFNASTSAAITQTVNKASSSSSVSSSINPSVVGQNVTFSAVVTAVAPGAGTPTGSVVFMDSATSLGSASLNGAGVGTFATAALSAGVHSITAVYSGDAHFTGSTSPAFMQTVGQASTTTSLAAAPNPTVFGQGATFTATVSVVAPGSGTRTGSVAFIDSGVTLGTSAVNASGQAAFTATTLSAGTHTIRASYLGDSNFSGSTSAAVTQTINKASTTTSLVSSLNPSFASQSVTFTATVAAVSPGAGTPDGTVTFLDGGATLGTAAVNGSGQAAFTTSTLSIGVHPITASYGGSSNYSGSSSAALSQTVNKIASTTGVASSLNPSFTSQTVTFTATVTGAGPAATGNVTFLDGIQTLGTGILSGSPATASLSTSTLSIGNHSIKVVYGGDANYNGSTSAVLTQTVTLVTTTTTITSSVNPSVYTQPVTFTAVVTSATGATPTGQVTFSDNGVGFATVNLDATGTAMITASGLVGGQHLIIAQYSGSSTLQSSSGSLTQTVGQSGTTANSTTSTNPAVFGQLVTFSVKVTGGGSPPTGTASFFDGTTLLGTVMLGDPTNPATAGKASLSVGPPAGQFMSVGPISAGTHSITAVYNGNPSYSPTTSNVINQVVNKDSTTVSLASSLNPSTVGVAVTFTATVTAVGPGTGIPTGTVTFKDGNTSIGSGMLDTNGNVFFTTSTLTSGNHTITASYAGDANFNASVSGGLTQTVNPAATTTTLTSSLNPSTFGQSATFTATVTSLISGTPTGTVTFKDGATSIGSGTLNGSAQATFTAVSLSGGIHTITATYSGDANFSSSTGTLTQTVNAASTSTALASSTNPGALGTSVTFTATVTGSAGTPTGTLTFMDGAITLSSTTLNGSGQASFTTSTLSGGTHSISAVYAGTNNFAPSTGTLNQTMTLGPSKTTLTDSVQSSQFGFPFTLTATVTSLVAGFTPTGTVTFLDSGVSFGSGTLNGSGVATFTTSSLSAGLHTLTANYSGDTNFSPGSSTPITHTVTSFGSTTTLASSLDPSVFGQSVTFTATVTGGGPGTPTGTVTFFDSGTSIGSGALNGSAQATFTTTTLSGGTHSITATYGGDNTFAGSSSAAVTQTVTPGSSSTAVTSSGNPTGFGATVTFTATVSAVAPAAGTATGTVTFIDGAMTLGSAALSGGQATFSTSTLTIGNHSITAAYGGDTNFTGSTSAVFTQTISSGASTTTLASSVNPTVFGQSVTFTAMVTGSGSGTPTGTVTFLDGGASIGSVTLSGGKATLTKSNLTVANHSVTAAYSGDANFASSTSAIFIQTVNKANSSTALVSSLNPADSGTTVSFTATVTAVAPGAGVPTGTVTFLDGIKSLANITLNSSGKAVFSTSTLSIGTHSMTAKYNGDANFNTNTSNLVLQTINNGGLIASHPDQSALPAPVGGNTSTVLTASPAISKWQAAADVAQPALAQISSRPTSLDDSLRDEFFSLVGRGEEKRLLGIRGVMKNVIISVFRLF
jgi:hypothetical protein